MTSFAPFWHAATRTLAGGVVVLLGTACGGPAAPAGDPAALAAHRSPRTWERLPGPGLERWRDPRTGIVFVRIPAGSFVSGAAEAPRTVRITKDFLLAETEWTVEQWRRAAALAGLAAVPVPEGPGTLPMPLSFVDAEAACQKLGYRLPTEGEWERACRADHSGADAPWSSPAKVREHAWYNANAGDGARPVATRAPNGFGLYDVFGNLWEWCSDFHGPLLPSAEVVVDPQGPQQGQTHALRGGSWFTGPIVGPETRTTEFSVTRSAVYGARPACDLP
ncbi:MAG: formylglycine-generating enzyme family protein [Planctomycetes bacterium]|nr:formylglycine-generating enzyme family protein [Planctomycetota bacterium]